MKTLIINGDKLLDWIADHPQVWEDMMKHFNPEGKDYKKIELTASDLYSIDGD